MSVDVRDQIRRHYRLVDTGQEAVDWVEIVERIASVESTKRPTRRRGFWVGIAAAVVTLLTVGGVAWLSSQQSEVEPAVSTAPATTLQCPITDSTEEFVPPEPYVRSRRADGMVWYGSDELWTVLMLDGDDGPRKRFWWSVNFPGGGTEERPEILVSWTRLDEDAETITNDSMGTNGWTAEDGWFMLGGIDPDIPGCWEVTASYKGATLSYVYQRT